MAKQRERIGKLASRWALVEGLPMHARVSVDPVPAGSPTVVFVHGLLVSSRYAVPTALRLAPYFRTYVPDLPGYGKSVKPGHVLTVPELADALGAWMDAIGLGRVALVSNSFGCQVAADFTARYPERVERLVLAGPTTDPQRRTAHQQIGWWLLDVPLEPRSLYLVVVRDLLDAGPRRALRMFQHMLEDRIEEKLPHVPVPTLVVRGSRDTVVPQRWVEEATRLLPQGRLVVIRGAPHTLNYNAPRALVRVVRSFLQEGATPRSSAA